MRGPLSRVASARCWTKSSTRAADLQNPTTGSGAPEADAPCRVFVGINPPFVPANQPASKQLGADWPERSQSANTISRCDNEATKRDLSTVAASYHPKQQSGQKDSWGSKLESAWQGVLLLPAFNSYKNNVHDDSIKEFAFLAHSIWLRQLAKGGQLFGSLLALGS